jgi:DNA-binding transcriptional ArsR family regulator
MGKEALYWLNHLPRQGVRLAAITWRILEFLARVHSTARGCYPCQARIAREVGVSVRTVNTHLRKLEQAGLIARQRRNIPGQGRLRTTLYYLPIDPGFARFSRPEGAVDKPVDGAAENAPKPADSARGQVQNLQTSSGIHDHDNTSGCTDPASPVEKCLAACGPRLDALSRRLIRRTDHIVFRWLEQGHDLERDILPILRVRTARPGSRPITSWAYFDKAVAERHARRMEDEGGRHVRGATDLGEDDRHGAGDRQGLGGRTCK